MTYIVGLRSESDKGFVISADSQETTTADEINYVEKIITEDAARWEVAIGGAGRGELVDGFIQHAIETIRKKDPSDKAALEQTVRDALVEFYETDVRRLPGKQKGIRFLVGVRNSESGETALWQSKGSRIFAVTKAAIGIEAPFADYILRRIYKPDLKLSQLVLLSVYLLTIAKETSLSVGGNTKLVVATELASETESTEYIAEIEQGLRAYEQRVNRVFLDCADTSIRVDQLEESLDKFKEAALALHREQIDRVIAGLGIQDFFRLYTAFHKLPTGTPITFGITASGAPHFSIEHDPEKIRQHREDHRAKIKQVESTSIHKRCNSCKGEYEYFVEIDFEKRKPPFNCPFCGTPNVVYGKVLRFRKTGETDWTVVAAQL